MQLHFFRENLIGESLRYNENAVKKIRKEAVCRRDLNTVPG